MKSHFALIFLVLINEYLTFNSTLYEEINIENLEPKLSSNEFTVLIFYTKYDKKSNKYSFLFNKIAEIYLGLGKTNINFCKINVYENIAIQSIYKLKSYPKFYLFFKSTNRYLECNSKENFNEDYGVEWIIENTKSVGKEIKYDNLNVVKESIGVTTVFFGRKESEEFKIIEFSIRRFSNKPKMNFYYCNIDFPKLDLIIYKDSEEISFPNNLPFNETNVFKFISINSIETISEVNYEFAENVFKEKNPCLIFYFNSLRDTIIKGSFYHNFLREIEKSNKDKLLFGYGNLQQPVIVNIAIGLGILKIINNASPVIFIHDSRKLLLKNYIFNNTMTTDNLNKFIYNWENNYNNDRFLRSTEIVTEYEGNIREISNNGLKKFILENEKSTVILFFDPNCRDCNKFFDVFEKVSYLNKYIVDFFKINVKKNDIDFIEIDSLPMVVISLKQKKLNFEIFRSEMNLENFSNFVKMYSHKSDL